MSNHTPLREVTWPDWRKAVPGETRVEHVRSGQRGTFVRWPRTLKGKNPKYATIAWDDGPFGPVTGRIVAYGFELRRID